jgi:hypothetical protein
MADDNDEATWTCVHCGASFQAERMVSVGGAAVAWRCEDTVACATRTAAIRRGSPATDIVAAGKATQFAKGNQAALMHGRGRPRKNVSKLMDTLTVRGLRAMAKVVFDKQHPWHDEHGPQMLRDLVKIVAPKRREITGKDGERLSIVDVHALVFKGNGAAPDDDEG